MKENDMEETIKIRIDGREVETEVGTSVLDAARDANIHIPALCSNDELKPYGACRMCMVEVTKNGRTKMVASCIYPVADGLEVKTKTERVLNVRKLVIELLLTRNPKNPVLRELADELDVKETPFEINFTGCILCGQCVRTCREVVGVSAIDFEGRGQKRKVATPFNESPPDCIACGACHFICPVGVIPMKEENGVRTIWETDYPLQKCKVCGRYFAPKKQLDYFSETLDIPREHFDVCPDCRNKV